MKMTTKVKTKANCYCFNLVSSQLLYKYTWDVIESSLVGVKVTPSQDDSSESPKGFQFHSTMIQRVITTQER